MFTPSPLLPLGPSSFHPLSTPLLHAPAADPWIFRHEAIWYSLQAVERTVQLRAASCLSLLQCSAPKTIWTAPARGPFSRNLWAPEMHFLDGRWYLYIAADDGRNENHRMWVLESLSPFGPWEMGGALETSGWAIDGTVLSDGSDRYFIWSGWPEATDGLQNLYIAPMKNPWTLAAPRRLLAQPTMAWEKVAMPLCEGPQLLRRDGRTFLIYSASGSWTTDYCLGMLEIESNDFLNPSAWKKHPEPVFQKTEAIWGVGHCCFAEHEAAGDLIFYHAKSSLKEGWDDRHIRVQPFTWDHNGLPTFGKPYG